MYPISGPPIYPVSGPPIYPVSGPPVYSVPPPGYVMVPQSRLAPFQSTPSAFGQGCLWGLLQGLLAALLLLLLKRDTYFYLGLLMGFFFYLVAGFRTTHKGGGSSRGGWAGFWAGITSTIIFWTAGAIGLYVLIWQRVDYDQRLGIAALSQSEELNRASQEVLSAFPRLPGPLAPETLDTALVVWIIGGLILAFTFGWIGGALGKLVYNNQIRQRGSP